jgi:glucans biosynthesis protein C
MPTLNKKFPETSIMTENIPTQNTRLYFLDWLRVIAFGLLVFYHAGLFFINWYYHFHNNELSNVFIPPMLFLGLWRLPLLFFISGCAIHFSFRRKTSKAFSIDRLKRLLIPLLFGILIVVPPQVYFELLFKGEKVSSYLHFYPTFFNGVYPTGNFTWNHLWYLAYLIAYTFVLLPLFRFIKHKPKIIAFIESLLGTKGGMFLLIIPLFLNDFFLKKSWPTTWNLIADWYNFFFYMIFLLYGFIISQSPKIMELIRQRRHIFFILGIVSYSILLLSWETDSSSKLEQFKFGWAVFCFLKSLNVVCWVFTLLGFSKQYLNNKSNKLTYLNQAVYPFYVLHQTVLIIAAYFVLKQNMSILSKYLIIVFVTYSVTLFIYDRIVRRIRLFRFLFGFIKK